MVYLSPEIKNGISVNTEWKVEAVIHNLSGWLFQVFDVESG